MTAAADGMHLAAATTLERDPVVELQRKLFSGSLNGATIDALADLVIEWVEATFPSTCCRVAMRPDDSGQVVVRESTKLAIRFADASRLHGPDDPMRVPEVGSVFCADTRAEGHWRRHSALCLVNGVKSFSIQPIVVDGYWRGSVAFYEKAGRGAEGHAGSEVQVCARDALALALSARHREQNERVAGDALKSLSQMIPGVVYQRLVTPAGDIRYTYISEGAREIFGVEPERILSDPEALFKHYDDEYRRTFRAKLIEASRAMKQWDVEATIRLPDGRVRFTHAIARPQKLADGSVLWTGVILDASRIKAAEAAAAAVEANTRAAIVEGLTQGILLFDPNDRLVIANSRFHAIYPRLRDVLKPGLSYEDFIRAEGAMLLEQGHLTETEVMERAERVVHREKRTSISERHIGDDNWIMVSESHDPEKGSVLLYTDVSELKRRERKIYHLAYHDVLTGLANRSSFRQRLSEALIKTS